MIFHVLWKNLNKMQVINPSTTMIDESVFYYNAYWVKFHGDMAEEDLPLMIDPVGEPVSTYTFVDYDHASNVVTSRSHTGILLFVWNGLIKAFSKQHRTVKPSTFG